MKFKFTPKNFEIFEISYSLMVEFIQEKEYYFEIPTLTFNLKNEEEPPLDSALTTMIEILKTEVTTVQMILESSNEVDETIVKVPKLLNIVELLQTHLKF